jgi:type IV pilus assembly protein PilE
MIITSKKSRGFTLIELMVVVAIIGVISAIAYPSYDSYMKKSRRADAKVALTRLVDREERFYLQNNTYTTSLGAAGLNVSTTSDDGLYTLSITSPNLLTGFTTTATAVAGRAQVNDTTTSAGDCRVLTLSSSGIKTPAACW